MWDPRNNSALPRNGALGVRRRFCFERPFVVIGNIVVELSNTDTKLGICRLLLFQCSVVVIESNESGVALRDRVPLLDVSTSRKTSRISGLRGCRDLVRPRTVRFKAFTRCLTTSAWNFGKPATLAFNSFADNSRPYININIKITILSFNAYLFKYFLIAIKLILFFG